MKDKLIQNKTKKNHCEKYELAITNYVLGEKTFIPKEELLEHLKTCASCQGDFRNWQATYSTMRAKEYDSRPDVKQRSEEFISKLTSGQLPSCKVGPDEYIVNIEDETGHPAGLVWHQLGKNGKMTIAGLVQKTNLDEGVVRETLGWLGKEKKIIKIRNHKETFICLTEEEQKKADSLK